MIQTRFVTTGQIQTSAKGVLAYELDEPNFKVVLYVIDRKLLSKEQLDFLNNEWVKGETFEFPEGTQTIYPDINSDSILPDDIKSDRTAEIRFKQNEWAIQLLTNKIWESYLIELANLKKKSEELNGYDKSLFEDTKSFWERVIEHKKERNISQERLDNIKEEVNQIFEKLKTFRKTESAEFEKNSTTVREEILTALADIKKRTDGKANFKSISEEIKALQQKYKTHRLLKSDETQIRKAYDDAFHFINEQRNKFFSSKNESRIAGLNDVISKMEKGLERDKKDLDYFSKKAETPRIQSLELQLLKVRIRQLKETIQSKEDKLLDIRKTLESVSKQNHAKIDKPEIADKTTIELQTPHEEAPKEEKQELPNGTEGNIKEENIATPDSTQE